MTTVPTSRLCPRCHVLMASRADYCPACGTPVQPVASGVGTSRWPLIRNGHAAVGAILIVNVTLFAVSTWMGHPTLTEQGEKLLPSILGGEWYRLLTAGYLHQGLQFSRRLPAWMPLLQFLHITLNMMGLWNIGTLVEEIYGTRRMFALYTGATLVGFLLSAMWVPAIPSLGASAGVFGLLGALIAYGVVSKAPEARRLQTVCLLNAGIGFLMGGFFPMIDNGAHLGGFLGGFAVAWAAGLPRWVDDSREKLWSLISLTSLLVTLWALGQLFYATVRHLPV